MSTTPHAVIQPKPGIGDVIWHLPFIRAIAAVSPGEQVTFLAPPTSGARELLVAEPAVAETIYFQHSGSELQRGINLMRLVALLRRRHFQKIWILDRTIRPALAAFLAGIPERIGVGLTAQRRFITNTGIPQSHFHDFPIEWLVQLMADMGVPFTTTEPGLRIPSETLAAIGERFAGAPRPWFVLGIAASHPDKDWSAAYWQELLSHLRKIAASTVFLIGCTANSARADSLVASTSGVAQPNQCLRPETDRGDGIARPRRFVHRHGFRSAQSRGRRLHRRVRLFRLHPGSEILEIHPPDRAGGRAGAGRHGADFTRVRARTGAPVSFAPQATGVSTSGADLTLCEC